MTRRPSTSIVANPVLIGAVTALVVMVGTYLAYNANTGLPFVPTSRLTLEVADGGTIGRDSEVREGGYRIGVVEGLEPVRRSDGRVVAAVTLKLDKVAAPVPVDSTFFVRAKGAIGGKYIDLQRGRSERMFGEGARVPLDRVETTADLDQVLSAFDAPTRAGIRRGLSGMGDGLVSRGADVNETIRLLPETLPLLESVMANLDNPRTRLERFIRASADLAAALAPVAPAMTAWIGDMATTFDALASDPGALQETIARTPPTLADGTAALRGTRPTLRRTAALLGDVEATARTARGALPPLTTALRASTPPLRRGPELAEDLDAALQAVDGLSRDPATATALRAVAATITTLQPQLRFLAPAETVCNQVTMWTTAVPDILSEPDTTGTILRGIAQVASNTAHDNVATMGANEFVTGRGPDAPGRLAPASARRRLRGRGGGGRPGRLRARPGGLHPLVQPARRHAGQVLSPGGHRPARHPRAGRRPGLQDVRPPGRRPRRRCVARAARHDVHPQPRRQRRPGGAVRRRQRNRRSDVAVGALAFVVVVLAWWGAFSRELPWGDHFVVRASFEDAANVKKGSPVRVAGVQVGKVTGVEHPEDGGPAAIVSFRLDDTGLPLHEDARIEIRPRTFLEGNYFLDLRPGSPSAPRLEDEGTIPVGQTSTAVRLGDVLSPLRKDIRTDLQSLLRDLDTAHEGAGARGLHRSMRWWEPAYRDTAIVADAWRGVEADDLPRFLDSAATVASAIDRSPPALRSLVRDLRTTAGALARERAALGATVAELPRVLRAAHPALGELNDAIPAVRRLAHDAEPGVRASTPALRAGAPFARETARLLSDDELGGLARDLRPAIPKLAALSRRAPALFDQVALASSCTASKLVPFLGEKIEDPDFPANGPLYEELPKSYTGIAGETRSGDANGQWLRVYQNSAQIAYKEPFGFLLTSQPLGGVNPPPPKRKAEFRPDVACETQELPDLRTRALPPPPGTRIDQTTPAVRAMTERAIPAAKRLTERLLRSAGSATRRRVKPMERLFERSDLGTLTRSRR